MTRACYSLALLLVALGGSSLAATSQAQCRTSADEHQFGYGYDASCPFSDGYIQTHEEDFESDLADDATSDLDVRGRSVVVVLEDPAVVAAENVEATVVDDQDSVIVSSSPENMEDGVQLSETPSTTMNSDNQSDIRDSGCYAEYYFHRPCPREAFGDIPRPATEVTEEDTATAGPAEPDSAVTEISSPIQDSQPVNEPDSTTDVCNQDYLRDYYQRYRCGYENPCQPDLTAGEENESSATEAQAASHDDVPAGDVVEYSKPYEPYSKPYDQYSKQYGQYSKPYDQYSTPYDAYDYSYRYRGLATGHCPSYSTEAVAEVVDARPAVNMRDFEDECYQAYLQRCADDAAAHLAAKESDRLAKECESFDAYGYEYRAHGSLMPHSSEPIIAGSVTVDEADQVSGTEPNVESHAQSLETLNDGEFYEPYGYESGYSDPREYEGDEQEAAIELPAQDQPHSTAAATRPADATSYEVYDYYHGASEAVVSAPQPSVEPTPSVEPAPSVPHYYGRYPYGYGYEYDYEYSKQEVQVEEVAEPTLAEPTATEAALPQDPDVARWVDLGREFLDSVVDSDLAHLVRGETERMLAHIANVIERMNFDQIRDDVAQAMVTALQQPSPVPSDWSDANLFLFQFDSDLNAEPLADAQPVAVPGTEVQVVKEQPQDDQDTAVVEPLSDDSVSGLVPINHDQVLQWARITVDSAVAAWDRLTIELQRFASRSVATVPADNGPSTHR
ncbi:MAG: hypothetical protein ACYC0X_27465 [Pirellulaceae bacterium]